MEKVIEEVEKFFHERCFVKEWEKEEQSWGETLIVEKEEKRELPCRLCRNPKIAVSKGIMPAETVYDAVLLFRKQDVILGGSKVEVEQEGGENIVFRSVGEMVSYCTHNEIALKREEVI